MFFWILNLLNSSLLSVKFLITFQKYYISFRLNFLFFIKLWFRLFFFNVCIFFLLFVISRLVFWYNYVPLDLTFIFMTQFLKKGILLIFPPLFEPFFFKNFCFFYLDFYQFFRGFTICWLYTFSFHYNILLDPSQNSLYWELTSEGVKVTEFPTPGGVLYLEFIGLKFDYLFHHFFFFKAFEQALSHGYFLLLLYTSGFLFLSFSTYWAYFELFLNFPSKFCSKSYFFFAYRRDDVQDRIFKYKYRLPKKDFKYRTLQLKILKSLYFERRGFNFRIWEDYLLFIEDNFFFFRNRWTEGEFIKKKFYKELGLTFRDMPLLINSLPLEYRKEFNKKQLYFPDYSLEVIEWWLSTLKYRLRCVNLDRNTRQEHLLIFLYLTFKKNEIIKYRDLYRRTNFNTIKVSDLDLDFFLNYPSEEAVSDTEEDGDIEED